MSLLIVTLIPAFNCEYTIAKVVVNSLENSDMVIVYDDGSIDDTFKILRALQRNNRLLIITRGTENRGKGFALKTLFNIAKKAISENTVFTTLDADDQHNPKEIPKLVKPIIDGEADVVIGTKRLRDTPLIRRIGTYYLDKCYGLGSQVGYRAYNGEALESIELRSDGFSVDTEILMQLRNNGLRICYVPVSIKYHFLTGHTTNPLKQFIDIVKGAKN